MHRNNGNCPSCADIIKDCTKLIQDWFKQAQQNDPTLHTSTGYRDKATQESVYRNGLSHARFGQGPHNYRPSPAVDVWFLIDGKYNARLSRYLNLIKSLPDELESGINFPKGLVDANHIQEKNWKTKVAGYPNGNT